MARDSASRELVFQQSGIAAESDGTNALAEWRAAYEALAWLARAIPAGGWARVEFRNDHAGLVRAASGDAPVPTEPETRRLAQECRRLVKDAEESGVIITFTRVPRWENAEADALASEAHRSAGGSSDVVP